MKLNDSKESLQNLLFLSSLGSLNRDLNVSTIKPVRGEFPINGWKQYPLEVTREGCKRSITGRCLQACQYQEYPDHHREDKRCKECCRSPV